MLSAVAKFLRWILEKFAGGALIVVLGLGVCAIWLHFKDSVLVDLDQWRQDTLRVITGQQAKLRTALADVHQRLDRISTDITADQDRIRQADKVIAELKGLASTWDRYVGDRERQKQNDARLASVTALRQSLADKLTKEQEEFTHATWERDGLEIALGKLDVQVRAVEAKRSRVLHYIDATLNFEVGHGMWRMPLKWWAVVVLGLYFVGPTLGKLAMYFVIAAWIVRGRPVRLAEDTSVLPSVGESRVAIEVALHRGERLWVKEKFLQASDEGLQRKTRYVLDWRIPFTCVATGLTELIEMANTTRSGAEDQRLTLSNQSDPHSELAIVTLADGASIVLRPSFLAGVVTGEGQRLKIRRRWQLFRWQAWVTLQLRFFEFVGPCRLIVAGSRGVRAENLADRTGPGLPARRTNQDATIGFTPNLDYRPVRAETFWSYYRGMNPLFDDLFAGRGIFLCQQVATEGDAKKARKFWSTVWGGVMKVLGI
jgi:hypothetical protein